jgi:magnesium transporter
LLSVYLQQGGETQCLDRVEPAWLDAASGATFWVDLSAPSDEELRILAEVFHFHPLSVEDARSELQLPKMEPYEGYLYLVLHGIDVKRSHQFATHDVDFFVGRNYLVTVHDGTSRSIGKLRDVCNRHSRVLAEGPIGLLHRIVDSMVDNYRPAVDKLEERITQMEELAFAGEPNLVRRVIKLKRDLGGMRRVLTLQRDAIGRLARREFATISDEMAYRFRDVYDHVARLSEEASLFHERISGILEVNLSSVSNRLNQVVKVLTVMSTIFLPLTVLTGMWGMNIELPHFPGGPAVQFWWILALMIVIVAGMLAVFRRKGWI